MGKNAFTFTTYLPNTIQQFKSIIKQLHQIEQKLMTKAIIL